MRTYFTYDPEAALASVIIIAPINSNDVFVYCPPIDGEDPWVEQVTNFETAEKLASELIKKTGQSIVLMTKDIVEWWKTGLSAVKHA